MDGVAYWNALATAVSTYVETQKPSGIPGKVRVHHRVKSLDLLAFVGSFADGSCDAFVSELEAKGYTILGRGPSASTLNWGVLVEPLVDEAWSDCMAYEALPVA